MTYTHLTENERYQIDEWLREGCSQVLIAAILGRDPSSISRELRRNVGARGWRPRQANAKALERLSTRGSSNASRIDPKAWEYAKKHLTEDQWSPEQICGRAEHDGLDAISHETIYLRILDDKKVGGDLYKNLRCKKKRKKRYGSSASLRGKIPNRVDIEDRPAIVESRERIGDWEGDTIIGTHRQGAVITSMVDRKSRYTCLAKSDDKTTKNVIDVLQERLNPIAGMFETITFDNGREFSEHQRLSSSLNADVFFAKPYHSWERGTNENTNGLVRQYHPKGKSFNELSDEDVSNTEKKLNDRPRKCLDYQTPLEVFSRSCRRRGIALRI